MISYLTLELVKSTSLFLEDIEVHPVRQIISASSLIFRDPLASLTICNYCKNNLTGRTFSEGESQKNLPFIWLC